MIEFFLPGQPPRSTAQEKKVRVVHGRPMYYEPEKVKAAKAQLTAGLMRHRPPEPLEGAVGLEVYWYFETGRARQDGSWKTTRPDTDNLAKLLKDCMTRCGYWRDDAQVVREVVEKRWSREPGICIRLESLEKAEKEDADGGD